MPSKGSRAFIAEQATRTITNRMTNSLSKGRSRTKNAPGDTQPEALGMEQIESQMLLGQLERMRSASHRTSSVMG